MCWRLTLRVVCRYLRPPSLLRRVGTLNSSRQLNYGRTILRQGVISYGVGDIVSLGETIDKIESDYSNL